MSAFCTAHLFRSPINTTYPRPLFGDAKMFSSASGCCLVAFPLNATIIILSMSYSWYSIFNLLGFNIIGVTFCACLGLGSFVGRTDNHPSLCQPHGSEYTTGLEEARQVLRLTQKVSKWVGETDLVHVSIIKIFYFVGQNVFN